MMGLLLFLTIVSVVIAVILTLIIIKILTNKKRKRMGAVYNLLKNDALNFAVQHPKQEKYRMDQKLIIEFISKKINLDAVFNVEHEIVIGRGKDCNLSIKHPGISDVHCIITKRQNDILIMDRHSSNGTIIKRGSKRMQLPPEGTFQLRKNDKIIISGIAITVNMFYLDKRFLSK